MSYAPAVPPLPHEFYNPPRRQDSASSRPPIPPLPPNYQPERPLVAPMPERAMPNLPADMARTLDDSIYASPSLYVSSPYPDTYPRRPSPAPPPPPSGPGYPGGFRPPSAAPPLRMGPSPAPYQPGGFVSQPSHYSLPNAMSNLTIQPPPRSSSAQPPSQPPPPPMPTSPPELTAPIPTVEGLSRSRPATPHVRWIRDVLFLVDRHVAQAYSPDHTGVISLPDPVLTRIAHEAISDLLRLLTTPHTTHIPEATYLRGTLHASGFFPAQVPKSPRDAFRDFETAARAGFQTAWFKLGRDYEAVGDLNRAKDCFERGVRGGVESCFYRMGMARLLGQLGLPASPPDALPLLHRAATLASMEVPQPAYVYGLLLLGEFTHVKIDERTFIQSGLIPPGSTTLLEARRHIERAAFLGFAPAQYKLGHAYEYAVQPFMFDPLLSVQYYSLASQQGEPEADMALSKWFLCGAEGAFDKDEALALTFADKAARKGLGSAEFAMGYYAEVGVGGPRDVDAARRWYTKAIAHNNADAPARLEALSQPTPQALSRTEHDEITQAKLVRKRTQAKMGSLARMGSNAGATQPQPPQTHGHGQGTYPAQSQGHPQPAQSPRPNPHPNVNGQRPPTQSPHMNPIRLTDSPQSVPQLTLPPGAMSPQSQAQPHQQKQQFQHQPRYSLSDGPTPISTPVRKQSDDAARRGANGNISDPGVGVGMGMPPPPQQHGGLSPSLGGGPKPAAPATFAEMGFQSGKAEDKDCVVM